TGDWMFRNSEGEPCTREQLLGRLQTHINTVVGRYRGQAYAWDVVNEAIEDKSDQYLRNTKWLEILGEDYLREAFEMAHQADPDALLFYNDYNETDPVKRDKIFKLVRSLLDQGTPIHGIGMQAHWNIYGPAIDEIRSALELYASLGLRIHITELDLSMFRFEDKRADLKAPIVEMLRLQEERYAEIFAVLLDYRKVIDSVTFWGVADDYTWLDGFPVQGRKNWPFLFDVHQQPKASKFKNGGHIMTIQLNQAIGKVPPNGNPLVANRYGADPYALVFGDRVYLYMTNDALEYDGSGVVKENTYSNINKIAVISSSDLVNWTDHGEIAVAGPDGAAKWATQSWAPAAVHKVINGKDKFFLYFANNASGIGVLSSDSPVGPWVDPIGEALILRSTPGVEEVTWLFDPAVLVDDDGKGYIYFGGGVPEGEYSEPGTARVMRLGDDMTSVA
ncbi:hypothetical protein KC345_g11592, partial [Hortaea werneckii]